MITAYCVKCKKKGVEMQDAKMHQTKKGGFMAKGVCPCDVKVTLCAMMSKDNAEKAMASGVPKGE